MQYIFLVFVFLSFYALQQFLLCNQIHKVIVSCEYEILETFYYIKF